MASSQTTSAIRMSSDLASFRKELRQAKHVVALTGAGVSAESGVPTFRGAGGFWRKWQATDLATPQAFNRNPSLVWEFYHYRREVMLTKKPNNGHIAIAKCEKRFLSEGRKFTVITQNIDELHYTAGSKNIIELHGSLFRVRCTKCGHREVDRSSPICEALKDRGEPDVDVPDARIPVDQLPKCRQPDCGGLVRPDVVWFGEMLDEVVLQKATAELDTCDLCLVVGTSSVVYPAAMFAPELASRGVTVAEFNVEETPASGAFKYYFQGPSGETLPSALAP
ncbi:hypothetical protein HELRODRAFT_184965 [Helobdella robusta]|uniref:NAD-dependent protein deacylase n=1 Tax=Helobdella robusta TaxID=6412 RepID=T1FM78_HELRO|nr:hypothetical protein HELRODRAFT_184965 [Helobdella robusta]ESO02068.1 hypothetical protein HELRODRAFT_184965 [Helobdella robusta]